MGKQGKRARLAAEAAAVEEEEKEEKPHVGVPSASSSVEARCGLPYTGDGARPTESKRRLEQTQRTVDSKVARLAEGMRRECVMLRALQGPWDCGECETRDNYYDRMFCRRCSASRSKAEVPGGLPPRAKGLGKSGQPSGGCGSGSGGGASSSEVSGGGKGEKKGDVSPVSVIRATLRDLEKNLGEGHPAVKELKSELETRAADPATAHADVEKLRTVMMTALHSAVKGELRDQVAVETQFDSLLTSICGALPPLSPKRGLEVGDGLVPCSAGAMGRSSGVGASSSAAGGAVPSTEPQGGAAMDEDGGGKGSSN